MPAEIFVLPEESEPETTGTQTRAETRTELAHDLNGRAIVDISNGEKIGSVSDILFDPDTLQIAGLLFSGGNLSGLESLFHREIGAIPAGDVRVWGKDVILVETTGEFSEDRLPQRDKLVKLSDQLKGRYVVSTDGTRIGQVDDVLVDDQGWLAGYHLSQVFIDGPLAESKRIPVSATSSLGKDVLIVDRSKF